MAARNTNSRQRRLTDRQQAFVAWYLQLWNASEAARRAGYSPKTAGAIGAENLTKPEISAEIDRRKAELLMSPDEVLARLTEQARAAYAPYITTGGSIDMPKLILDGKAHLIKKIKPGKEGLEVEFYDAQSALVQIAKAHGLDRVTLTGPDGGPIKTEHTEKLDLTKLSADQLRDLRTLLAKAQSDDPANAG